MDEAEEAITKMLSDCFMRVCETYVDFSKDVCISGLLKFKVDKHKSFYVNVEENLNSETKNAIRCRCRTEIDNCNCNAAILLHKKTFRPKATAKRKNIEEVVYLIPKQLRHEEAEKQSQKSYSKASEQPSSKSSSSSDIFVGGVYAEEESTGNNSTSDLPSQEEILSWEQVQVEIKPELDLNGAIVTDGTTETEETEEKSFGSPTEDFNEIPENMQASASYTDNILHMEIKQEYKEDDSEEDSDAVDEIVQTKQSTNKYTERKTRKDVGVLQDFINTNIVDPKPVHLLDPIILNEVLVKFFAVTRKADGDDYEPQSLRSFFASYSRHLASLNYRKSLPVSRTFTGAREALKAKQKELKIQGKGKEGKGSRYRVFLSCNQEIEKILYDRGELGINSAQALIQLLYWNNTFYFELLKRKDHRELTWGDISLKVDHNGKEYLQLNERPGKSRARRMKSLQVRTYEGINPQSLDPVFVYKLYLKKRPKAALNNSFPFYLIQDTSKNPNLWYKPMPMGVNSLSGLIKGMYTRAGISLNNEGMEEGDGVNNEGMEEGDGEVYISIPPSV